jgi:hypothetical protein
MVACSFARSAGAASAVQGDSEAAVNVAYARLRARLKSRLAGRPVGEVALSRHEAAPQAWEQPLRVELVATDAGDDADVVAAAQALMELVDEAGSRSGRYNVTVQDSQGVLAQVTLASAQDAATALKSFPVRPAGAVVTITVSVPGLIPLGDLEQDLTVPFAADSDPVRFGFLAGPVGLHTMQVRAFAGGTCLGELRLEISVQTGATIEEGRPRTAPMADLAAEPGEVTLQVSRTTSGGYSFQLLSEALYPAVIIDRLAGDQAVHDRQRHGHSAVGTPLSR